MNDFIRQAMKKIVIIVGIPLPVDTKIGESISAFQGWSLILSIFF